VDAGRRGAELELEAVVSGSRATRFESSWKRDQKVINNLSSTLGLNFGSKG
jgi:hypothetical protein